MRIFGSKEEEITGGWRKLHDELCSLYCSPHLISMINKGDMMGRACSILEEQCI
jgi:hypothetical protein